MTPTPTSGAADLPEALRVPLDSLHADAGYLCGRLLNGSLTQEQVVESIRRRIDAAKLAALTAQAISAEPAGATEPTEQQILEAAFAPAQPAAQQGAAYAALPTSSHAGRVYEEGFLIGTCPLYTADQLRAFADATHTLRASHGQAPATQQAGIPGNFITHRAAWREALETAKFVSTGVDRSYWDHELAAFDRSFDRLWTLMQDAPRKQGASHDR